LPGAHGALQSPKNFGLRPAAQDIDREDTEVLAPRTSGSPVKERRKADNAEQRRGTDRLGAGHPMTMRHAEVNGIKIA
jgi:hypothetical protein